MKVISNQHKVVAITHRGKQEEVHAGMGQNVIYNNTRLNYSMFYNGGGNLPAFQASPTCGLADFSTHEANAMHTKHISDCLRGTRVGPRPARQGTACYYSITIQSFSRRFYTRQ